MRQEKMYENIQIELKTAPYRSMKNKKIYQPDIFSFSNDSPKKIRKSTIIGKDL